MSKQADKEKTQSHEADSSVLSGTILESQLEEIKRDLRGKVSGKFLRLTMDNENPVFVRCDHISAYHDRENALPAPGAAGGGAVAEFQGFLGCWITGTGFGFSIKERAEDLQALIAQVEGEYSASELAETLIALLVVAGTDPAEARALLSTAPREALAKRINALGERLAQSEVPRSLVNAGEELYLALGGESSDSYWDDPPAAMVRCIDQAVSKLRDAKLRESALLDKGGHLRAAVAREQADREMFGRRHEALMQAGDKVLQALDLEAFDEDSSLGPEDHGAMLRMLDRAVELIGGLHKDKKTLEDCLLLHRSEREKLSIACGKVLRALGIAIEPDPALGHDKHSHLLLALTVAAERIEALQADAAKDASLAACIEQQQVEIERQQEEIEKQRRDIAAFRGDAAACLKTADNLRARLADALRQLPEPVQRDLERVWTIRETAGGQS